MRSLLLAALMLFGGGVLLAVTFFRTEVRALRFDHEHAAGVLIAESELERLAAVPWSRLTPGDNQPMTLDLPAADRLKSCRGFLTVREPEPGLREATVRIVWDSAGRYVMEESLTRRFARSGMR